MSEQRPRRSIRRDITLPLYYDARIRERKKARGVGYSEAVRQAIDEADNNLRLVGAVIAGEMTAVGLVVEDLRRRLAHRDETDALRQIRESIDRVTRAIAPYRVPSSEPARA